MADDEDQDAKTEDPSERKLEEARREGRLPLSRETGLVAGLVAGFGALASNGKELIEAWVGSVRAGAVAVGTLGPQSLHGNDPRAATAALGDTLADAALPALAVVAAVAGTTLIAGAVQTRGGFWPAQLMPKLDRIFSPQRVLHPFSRQGVTDLGVTTMKTIGLMAIAYLALAPDVGMLRSVLHAPVSSLLSQAVLPALHGAKPILGAFFALAVVDVVLVRRRYFDQMKSTKEELKREAKEEEGDPHIKGRRKRKHRELTQGRVAVEVPRADAIVVNPTHIAVAIRYRKKTDKAPRVTAKGKGTQAEVMRELARKHGVPIVRDVPLARLLHKKVKVGREVPAQTYRAVAAVLAFVYKITGRPPGTGLD